MDALAETRWTKRRRSQERWKAINYERYLLQKRRLAGRPEYLAHRRATYAANRLVRSMTRTLSLSTDQTDDDEETYETTAG